MASEHRYDVKELYTMFPISEMKITVGVSKYTNEFDVQFELTGANIILISSKDLNKYGYKYITYTSSKLSITNQLKLSKDNGGLFFNRELILDIAKNDGKISKNSVNIRLAKIQRNKFLLSIERTFLNSVKPFKQSVSFHWIVDVNPDKFKRKVDVRKYTFNDKPKYKLINPILKGK